MDMYEIINYKDLNWRIKVLGILCEQALNGWVEWSNLMLSEDMKYYQREWSHR